MIRLANGHYLQFFWLIPLLAGFFWYAFRKKSRAMERFGSHGLMKKLTSGMSRRRQFLKACALIVCSASMIGALARPQIGTRIEEVTREGQDVFVAVDVSRSMLAEDIRPSRLEKAKHEISGLIDRLRGDRIGLIVFAGEAFVQSPLTLDYSAAKLLLSVVNPDLIPLPGTNISHAIRKATKSFEQDEQQHKILVLITDGEDHSREAEAAAGEAADAGVVIYTVGIGSVDGVPIPETDETGAVTGYTKDNEGRTVVTKLDELTLEKIALITHGTYFHASPEEAELDALYEEVAAGETKELGTMEFTLFEERFQFFVGLFILILIWETLYSDRKQVKTQWKGRFL